MKLLWEENAWNEYCNWQTQDKKTLKRINALIRNIQREPYDGIGKPERLSSDLSAYWSRRIDDTNRIVYRVEGSALRIIQCGSHYRDK